LYNSYEVSLPY